RPLVGDPFRHRLRGRYRGRFRGRTGQDFAGEILGEWAMHQRRERDDPIEGPPELSDVVGHEVCDARQHFPLDGDVLVAGATLDANVSQVMYCTFDSFEWDAM